MRSERPKPIDPDKLTIQRLAGELAETKHWLAVLIAIYGDTTGHGGQLVILADEAEQARKDMGYAGIPEVSVTYDSKHKVFIMDAI